MMEIPIDIKQEETIPDTCTQQNNGKQHLLPFVCGLCDCSYGQFVLFYKHFKKHRNEVGNDSFHICEDLASSERDVCEDQPGSLEKEIFNCGICAASFVTVCMLHEHMKKHESKGSYTLDMQSKTGYPSSKQYPYVSLGSNNSCSFPTSDGSLSKSRAKNKNPSKRGIYGNIGMPDSEMRNTAKRGRTSNYEPPPEIGIGTREGSKASFHGPSTVNVPDSEMKVEGGQPSNCDPPQPQVGSSIPDSSPGPASDHMYSDEEDNAESDNPSQYGLLDASVNGIPGAKVKHAKVKQKRKRGRGRPKKVKNIPVSIRCKRWGRPPQQDLPDDAKLEPSKEEVPEDPETYVRVTRGRNSRQLDKQSDSTSLGNVQLKKKSKKATDWKSKGMKQGRRKRKKSQKLNRPKMGISDNKETTIATKSESGDPLNESSPRKLSDKSHDDVKGSIENAEKENMVEDDDEDEEDFDSDEEEDGRNEDGESDSELEDDFSLETENGCINTESENLKIGSDGEELSAEKFAETEGQTMYALRRKQRAGRNEKPVVKVDRRTDQEMYDEDYVPGKNPVKHMKRVRVLHYSTKRTVAKCNLCGMLIPLYQMRKHQVAHKTSEGKRMFRPENLIKCKDCGRVLFRKRSSHHKCIIKVLKEDESKKGKREISEEEREEKKRQSKVNSMVPCQICGNLYHRSKIQDHIFTHEDGKQFSCSQCSKSFKTPNSLKLHVYFQHSDQSFRCDQCDCVFKTMNRLNIHYRTHTGETPYKCPTCEMSFRSQASLTKHTYIHRAVRYSGSPCSLFICEEYKSPKCKISFRSKAFLSKHTHIHREVDMFRCKECSKTFKTSYYLKNHIRAVHRNEKNWVCSWPKCGLMFVSGSHLRRHMLTHTGEKPEECPYCDSAFSQRGELRLHIQKIHKNGIMPPPKGVNPYSNATPIIIERPVSSEDPDQSSSTLPWKTLSFDSGMSNVDIQALQQQMASQTRRRKPGRSGQKAPSSIQSSLAVKTQLLVSHMVGDASTERGISDRSNDKGQLLASHSVSDANIERETSDGDIEKDKLLVSHSVDDANTKKETSDRNVDKDQLLVSHRVGNANIKKGTSDRNVDKDQPLVSCDISHANTEQEMSDGSINSHTNPCVLNSSVGTIDNTEVHKAVETLKKTNTEPFSSTSQSEQSTKTTNTAVMLGSSSLPLLCNTRTELGASQSSSEVLQETSRLPLFSNTHPEIRADVTDSPFMSGANSLSMYIYTKPDLGPSNTFGCPIQESSSQSLYRHTKPDLGTSKFNAFADSTQATSSLAMYRHTKPEEGTNPSFTGLTQGSGNLSLPLEYAGSQASMIPSSMDFQPDFMADDSVLTTMTAAIPYSHNSN